MSTAAVPHRPYPQPWLRWPLIADVVIAGLLLVIGARQLAAGDPNEWAGRVLLLGLVAPLLLRRRAPVLAFGLIAAFAFAQWCTTEPAAADAALLIAFYSVAVSCSRRLLIAAAVVLEIGVLLAVVRYAGVHGGIMAFIFLSGLVTAAGVLGISVRVRRAYLAEVEQRAARLELERDQQAQLAVAAERARVAREMHDIVAHNLSVMIALTDGAALTLASDPQRAGVALEEVSRAGRLALTDMRRVLGLLRNSDNPAARAPAPGVADLEGLLDTVRHTGLQVRYETSGPLADLEPGIALSAYRIVQEAVTNTLKHAADAHLIDVALHVLDDGVQLTVHDDGRVVADATPGGHGIVGMRERAAVHRGAVHAGPTPAGWLVRAWLPRVVPDRSESAFALAGT